jgi:hypothetical protein
MWHHVAVALLLALVVAEVRQPTCTWCSQRHALCHWQAAALHLTAQAGLGILPDAANSSKQARRTKPEFAEFKMSVYWVLASSSMILLQQLCLTSAGKLGRSTLEAAGGNITGHTAQHVI